MARKPKANPEHEKLIETLKFTPRTYKIRLWGYGGEYVMGTVERKVYDYFKRRRLDLAEFAWSDEYAEENKIPEDMFPFFPGSWHECEDMGHCWGVDRSAGTIQVDDENGETVYEKELENIDGWNEEDPEPEWACGDEIWIDSKPAGTPVFIGVSSEKGTFFEGDIELKMPFDPAKITLTYDEIDGNEIITHVSYDGEVIDNWGGDTTGKGTEFGFYVAGSNKQDGKGYERYRNMDDIDYTLTDWFPKKVKPVREGKYEVETKDGYTYHANWSGSEWFNTWNSEEPIKIKQWRGVAYDPDEQDLRDELTNIVIETETMNTNLNPWAKSNSEPEEPKTLTYWTVKTLDKKSVEEIEYFTKDGMTIVHRTGWRWGEWTVATNDGNPPEFEFDCVPGGNDAKDSINMNSCYENNIEESNMEETSDGWFDDIEWPEDIDPEERQQLEEAIDEEGCYSALEDNGWYHSDTDMWIWGPIEITDSNGNVVKTINE